MIGVPAAIRDAVHLLLWWRFAFFSPFVSFTLKGVKEIYCGSWLLETLLCLEFISTTPALGDFLRAAVLNKNPRPCELEVLVSLFGQVVVTGNVYRHFLKFISGSWESQHPELWSRVNYS